MTLMACVSAVGYVSQTALCVLLPQVTNCLTVFLFVVFDSPSFCFVFVSRPMNCLLNVIYVFVAVQFPLLPLLVRTSHQFLHISSDVFCVSSAAQDWLTLTVSQNSCVSYAPFQQKCSKVPTVYVICVSHDVAKQKISSSSSPLDSLVCHQSSASLSSDLLCDHHQHSPPFFFLCVFSSALVMETEMSWKNLNLTHQQPSCNVKQSTILQCETVNHAAM